MTRNPWPFYFSHACSVRRCRGKATIVIGRRMGGQWWLCWKHLERLQRAEAAVR